MAALWGFLAASVVPAAVTTTGSIYDDGTNYEVGYIADGTLSIDAGSSLSRANGYLGYGFGYTGAATVSGLGSRWVSSSSLYPGYAGKGTLDIQSGGQVSDNYGYVGNNSGSTGTVTVNGNGSIWANTDDLYVGNNGGGTLGIEAGGQVFNNYGYLGNTSGSTGAVTVTGNGSMWANTYDLFVGNYGSGTLDIEAGGQVINTTANVGFGFGSTGGAVGAVTVTGAGSIWTNRGYLYVGSSGSGTLNVQAGGQVSNIVGYLGYYGHGTATVSGAGSKWTNSGNLVVGDQGSATLSVSDGGVVTAKTLCASLGDLYGNGTISVNGAVLDDNLVFDSTHGVIQTIPFGTGGSLNLNVDGTGDLGAGFKGSGSLRIAEGRSIASVSSYLGYESNSTGTATVTGAGSKWTSSGDLWVGFRGKGALNVQDGGQVSDFGGHLGFAGTGTATVTGAGSTWANSGNVYVGYSSRSGTLTVSNGGLVTAKALYASTADLYGNGTISANGAVLDDNLVFDSTHGAVQTIPFGSGGSLNLNVDGTGDLGAGYRGTGALRIADGVAITSVNGIVGFMSPSTGTATVSGAGSAWTNKLFLYLGFQESKGILNIQDGGQVSNTDCYVAGNNSVVTVSGAGSKWTNNGDLYLGKYAGSATVTVSDHGRISATSLYLGAGQVNLHVSGNSMLVLGNATTIGSLTINGVVKLYADSFLNSGTYTPITEYAGRAMTWSGSGSYGAIGGAWDNSAKTFTVKAATLLAAAGLADISSDQRLLITDAGSGQEVGASFGTVGAGITFSASPISSAELSSLMAMPGLTGSVLAGWDFTTNLGSQESLLSFNIGLGHKNLSFWHLSGGTWTAYVPDWQTYDSAGIVSFPVSSFSGYAVTGVPEPATTSLLALAGLAAVTKRRRRS